MSDSISEFALSLTNLSKRVLIDISMLELFEAHFLKETFINCMSDIYSFLTIPTKQTGPSILKRITIYSIKERIKLIIDNMKEILSCTGHTAINHSQRKKKTTG